MTLYPLHTPLSDKQLRNSPCVFCICDALVVPCARPVRHDGDGAEKTALFCAPSLSQHVSVTARSAADDKSSNTGQQRGIYIYVSPVSGVTLWRRCPFHCQYQQKCQQWASVSNLCHVITGRGACWVLNAALNPSLEHWVWQWYPLISRHIVSLQYDYQL